MGNSHKNLLVWNQLLNWNQTDKIVIGWSSSKIVSGSRVLSPRWPPQCNCVVIESSFDPGERLQAPGSLWFVIFVFPLILLILLMLKYHLYLIKIKSAAVWSITKNKLTVDSKLLLLIDNWSSFNIGDATILVIPQIIEEILVGKKCCKGGGGGVW